jgi:hypothetical protein
MPRAHGRSRDLSPPTPGDILCSEKSLPQINWIYVKDSDGREHFFMKRLSSYLAFLETVVLHERIVVGSANIEAILEKGDTKSEAYDHLNTEWALKYVNQVQRVGRVLDILERDGILNYAEVRYPNLTASELVEHYAATPSMIKRRQVLEKSQSAFERNKGRLQRIVLHRIALEVGVPLLLTEFASRASIPLRVSLHEASRSAPIMNIDRRIESGVVEHLKKKLDAGAMHEIDRLEELGHTTIFPRTPIAGQILSESEKAEDMLDVALSLRKQYADFRRQMGVLESEIFDPGLTLAKKRNMLRGLNSAANELWPATTSQSQQVTSEISAVSNLAFASMNPLNFKDITDSVLSIVSQPWDLIRKHLRRRKVRAMLQTKRAFLNSKPTIEAISKIFRCPTRVIRRTELEEDAYRQSRKEIEDMMKSGEL